MDNRFSPLFLFAEMKALRFTLFTFFLFSFCFSSADTIDSLETQLENASTKEKLAVYIQLSKAYWTVKPEKGLIFAQKAILLADKYGNPQNKAKALLYGGVNAWFMGDYDQAAICYQKSLAIAEKIGDKKLTAFNLNNLGMVNKEINNYEKALDYYNQAANIMKDLDDEIEYAKINHNIGELNMLLGNDNKALNNFLTALDIIQKYEEPTFLIWLLHDLGCIYYQQENYKLALQHFSQALQLSDNVKDNVGKSKIFNQIGKVYLKKKEYDKAKNNFDNALKYARLTNAKNNVKNTYKNISDYYAAVTDYKKSLEYYQLFKQISDSLINENKNNKIVEMQTKYETEKKEKENKLLRKNNEIKRLIIEKQTYLRNFFIVLFVFAILVIVLIYSRFSINKKINKQLNEKNNLIIQQKNQLSQTLKELEETNAAKDHFFSIIAHDLRSPFHTMLGYSKILERRFDSYDTLQQKKFIGIISQALQKNYKLLENLLLWAQSQRGSIPYSPEKINLYSLSEEVITEQKIAISGKEISLENKIPEDIRVKADKNMLSTVFRNLLSNAVKFTPAGGKIILIATTNPHQFAEIRVKDTGLGIPKKNQANLFDITTTPSTKGTENETGTGLGLILCKEFIEKHKGKMWVISEQNKGSEFIFTVPVLEATL